MHLVRALLPRLGSGPCEASDVARLVDALWAHSIEADCLEHIRGRSAGDSVELILFLRESAGRDPELCALDLVARAHRSSAALRATFDSHPYARLCEDFS